MAELAGTGTDLANYTSVLSCTGVAGVTGSTSGSWSITLAGPVLAGSAWVLNLSIATSLAGVDANTAVRYVARAGDTPAAVRLARGVLHAMGLERDFAPLVLLVGRPVTVETPQGASPMGVDIGPELPAGLPRAEDFDAGDTEILAESLNIKSSKRWLRGLPWKKR